MRTAIPFSADRATFFILQEKIESMVAAYSGAARAVR